MKRNAVLLVALVGLSLSWSSCKKDYVCNCQKIFTQSGTTTTEDDGMYTYKDTRPRAEDKCNDQESTGTDIVKGDYTRECQIK
jgi:hypothetical protein